MERILLPLALLATLVLASFAFPEPKERLYGGKYRRNGEQEEPEAGALNMQDVHDALDCRIEGETCWGVPKCCNELRCAWAGGFEAFTKGTCVNCVGELGDCQVDSQCCENLQCDKEKPVAINGHCKDTRGPGQACFENSQCPGWCERKLFHIWGYCEA